MRQLIPSDCNADGEINPIELLNRYNWTHEQLAFKLRVSVSAVSKWSRGVHFPSQRIREDAYNLMKKLG